MAKTDVRAASLPGEDIERISLGLIALSISRSVNPDSAIANSHGVRSVGCASVELFDGVAKRDLRTTPSPQLQDSRLYSYLLFLDPPWLL